MMIYSLFFVCLNVLFLFRLKPLIGKRVDSIEHHERVITVCNQMLEEHQAMFERNPNYSKVAFATFYSIGDASNVLKSADGGALLAQPAPQEVCFSFIYRKY